DEKTPSSDVVLFQPGTAYRERPAGFTGTPLPRDEPAAPNPPSGAVIDYYMKQEIHSEITLDILDEQGGVVRHYSSNDKPLIPDQGKIVVTPDWFESQKNLSSAPGHHRFVWDLHYTPPEVLRAEPISRQEPSGILALPGQYTVKLAAGGQTYSQPLTVVNDPRVKISREDLARQQDLAKQLEAERVKLAGAIREIRRLLQQADAAHAKTFSAVGTKLAAFTEAVTRLTGIRALPVHYGMPGGAPTSVTGLDYLESALEKLQHAIDKADAAPSPDAITGFEQQRAVLQKSLKSWDELKASLLPDLNRALQREGLPELK
ncbi:MAG TPA: hypothetical protein VLR94_01105, partial [Acidobacteriota bacterium]|nr:hypothetical protein [Acidobacteriota bacterium]